MNARTLQLAAAALVAAAATAHGQSFFFDSGTGWQTRNSTNSGDLSFLGRNDSTMQTWFADGTLYANQWGGSLYNPFDGHVQFSVADDYAGNNAPYGRVATAFGWSTSGTAGYVWSNIPSNRQGALSANNPQYGQLFASKVGDTYQMAVHASNYYTSGGAAQAFASIRNAPVISNAGGFNNSMTNLNLLDLDPNRPGIQVRPGNIPVHLNVDAVTGSRDLIDFSGGNTGFGQVASPFRDDMRRLATFRVANGADVRFNDTLAFDSASWASNDGTLQKTLSQAQTDRLLSFTNADIGKTFDLNFSIRVWHEAYDADGMFVGPSRDLGNYQQTYSIEVIPTPGSTSLAALGTLLILRRRRR